jgi:hypothetical protein
VTLAQYLQSVARTPFQWGTADCATFLADWVLLRTGCDPMDGIRGTYSNEVEARRIIRPFGLGVFVLRCAQGVGLDQTHDPKPGDIGAIIVTRDEPAKGAIRTARGWVLRGDRRVVGVADPVHHALAIGVPCG